MAAIAITYTFSNSTTADASQVNQNFTDIINGLSDGTKDISVNAGTFAGNVSISGNSTLGNASGDDVTVTGSLASSIPIKTTNTYDIGSSSLGLRAAYFGANSQTVNIVASSSMSATWTFTLPVTAGTSGYYLKTNGSGVSSWQAFTVPTLSIVTTSSHTGGFSANSSGTYTTPANVKYIRIRMVGGGAGGGGGGTAATAGVAGNNTTWDTTLLVANGGGAPGGDGGAGGGGTILSGPLGTVINGGGGGGGTNNFATGSYALGGAGGNSMFGGGARGTAYGATGPNAAAANSGGGGGGGGSSTGSHLGGGGGGGGGGIDVIIGAPAATYAYSVGTGGAGGVGSVSTGGAGAAGYIEVTEYYS